MGKDGEDTVGYFEALHGAIASLTHETRLRLTELFDELAQTRAEMGAMSQRLDALQDAQTRLAEDVAKVADVLDEDSAGTLNKIKTDLEVIHGELVETRARVSDSELSVLDAYLLTNEAKTPRAKGAKQDA